MMTLDAITLAGTPHLAPLSDTLDTGELVGIIGPNGAGKSTLLSLLSGYRTPTMGQVMMDGVPLRSIPLEVLARQRALVAQREAEGFDWQVRDYLMLGNALDDSHQCSVLAAQLGLTNFLSRHLHTLSGGERQRVSIARALCQLHLLDTQAPSTRLLLLDEPTSALDIGQQQKLMRLLTRLTREYGLTIVCVLHDLSLAATYCHRLWLMDKGVRIAAGRVHDVIQPHIIANAFDADVTIDPIHLDILHLTP
ncbi:ABC transporter ATP-binding protein [Zymobacter palmae]|uniref:ABC-type hemin transpor tsystem, ATPase n=1 Tax=Zymobacter palmae TaxID=33074 RepID=A0A348HFR4_9GAMM|nr:ATP-binding cassette domain-containing protein [Zymobacter palmae]BBG30466.1 ABC-type hemin transpor tsystem, ATPase [Zymobacter palmae]